MICYVAFLISHISYFKFQIRMSTWNNAQVYIALVHKLYSVYLCLTLLGVVKSLHMLRHSGTKCLSPQFVLFDSSMFNFPPLMYIKLLATALDWRNILDSKNLILWSLIFFLNLFTYSEFRYINSSFWD